LANYDWRIHPYGCPIKLSIAHLAQTAFDLKAVRDLMERNPITIG
jgi:hypothetical protein